MGGLGWVRAPSPSPRGSRPLLCVNTRPLASVVLWPFPWEIGSHFHSVLSTVVWDGLGGFPTPPPTAVSYCFCFQDELPGQSSAPAPASDSFYFYFFPRNPDSSLWSLGQERNVRQVGRILYLRVTEGDTLRSPALPQSFLWTSDRDRQKRVDEEVWMCLAFRALRDSKLSLSILHLALKNVLHLSCFLLPVLWQRRNSPCAPSSLEGL